MELAFTGAMAWAAWQVLGKLQRHSSKLEKTVDEGLILGLWEEECKKRAVRFRCRLVRLCASVPRPEA